MRTCSAKATHSPGRAVAATNAATSLKSISLGFDHEPRCVRYPGTAASTSRLTTTTGSHRANRHSATAAAPPNKATAGVVNVKYRSR